MSGLPDYVKAEETKIGVFLTAHHLILYCVLALFISLGVYLVESKIAAVETARADSAVQALAVEKDHVAQLQKAYEAAEAERVKQNETFLAAIQQAQSQAKVQIVHDRALSPPDLGHRIETITGFKQGTITLDATQDLVVPLPLGQEIVARLDQGAADAVTVVNQSNIIANNQKTISDQSDLLAQDKMILGDQIKTDGEVLSAEKAKNRKSMWKHIGIGVGIGVALTARFLGKV